MNNLWLTYKLRVAPGMKWIVEYDGLHLWDPAGQVRFIAYPEAALWDLLSRGYRYTELCDMLSHITLQDANLTATWLHATVADWRAAGWLIRENSA